MKEILVTGGCGFIGSHLVDLLISKGYAVTVLDNLSQGKLDWLHPRAKFDPGDVTDLDLVRKLCYGKQAVFHLAAMSRVLPSVTGGPSSAKFSAEQNILGTLNVLIASTEEKVEKVIYSASSTVYGNRPSPQSEDTLPDLLTPYAISKFVGELYCKQFSKQYNLKTICLRYFQVYGPRQPTKGEYAMVTGIFLDQAKRGLPLTIHGDGSQRRDFVHVKDVAKANLLAIESNPWDNGVVNVGTGVSTSIKELADMISPNQERLPGRDFDMIETKASKPFRDDMIDFKTGMDELLHK